MFDKLKDLRELFRPSKTKIDGYIFSLHYKPTSGILVAMSLIIVTNWFFKSQINCVFGDSDKANFRRVAEDYCLLHSPYVVFGPDDAKHGLPAHPGVRQTFLEDSVKYQLYYQWVPFMCIVQAIVFYFPRFLWFWCERGRVKIVTGYLKEIMINHEERNKKRKIVVEHIMKSIGKNKSYGYGYLFCECLNFANVIGQAYLTDVFLGYEFSTYGFEVLSFMTMNPALRTDPMARIFPRTAKCTFNMHGVGGSIEPRDGICVLTSNVLYEKIYVWMWCWFGFLSILSGLNILDMMITIISKYYRSIQLCWCSPLTSFRKVRFLCKEFEIGDWLYMLLLGKNLHPAIYHEIIEDLSLNLEMQKNNGRDYANRISDSPLSNGYADVSSNRVSGTGRLNRHAEIDTNRPYVPARNNPINSTIIISEEAVNRIHNENEVVNICRSYC